MKKKLAELITIFLGVALAFLAEDFREYRGERAEEREILLNLASDFDQNSIQLATQLAWQQRATSHLVALDELLAGTAPDAWLQVPDTLLTAVFSAATYDPARGSVDAILSSGKLGLVRDEQLRAAVAGWPGRLMDVAEDQTGQRNFVLQTLTPYLLQLGVPVRDLLSSHRDWVRGETPEAMRRGSTRLQATNDLRGMIGTRLFMADITAQDLGLLSGYEDVVRGLLRTNGAPAP